MCWYSYKQYLFKGTVQRDFWPTFFSSFEPAWVTDQHVKTFSILVQISQNYSNFSESPPNIIPQRVIWLFWILIKETVQQNVQPVFFIIQGCLGHWVMGKNIFNFRRVIQIFLKYLPGVSYRGESVFPKYHTLESHSWPRGVNCQFLNCLHRPLKG